MKRRPLHEPSPRPQPTGAPGPRRAHPWITRSLRALKALSLGATAACSVDDGSDPSIERHLNGLAARCTAEVRGVGQVDVERTYLPAVIACENGAAADEALKAQAVAARTYLYFKLETSGSIADGTADQVFTCPRPAQPRHIAAVEATAGEVLMFNNIVLAAFYVAGAIPNPPECVAGPGDRDPTGTERWVTYNAGNRGANVQPSPLGHLANPRNRGCKSQNGAHCLATAGRNYRDILRFYYGEDVVIERAVGACVDDPDPDPDPVDLGPPRPDQGPVGPCAARLMGDPLVIDERDPCFERSCESGDWWVEHPVGEGGSSLSTGTIERDRPDCVGRWHFEVARAGEYALDVHLPDPGVPLTRRARYVVHHAGRATEIRLDQSARAGWVSLGRFDFTAGGGQHLALLDNTGEPYRDDGERLVYDAIRLRAPATGPSDVGPPEEDRGVQPEPADQGPDARPDGSGPEPDPRPDPQRPDLERPEAGQDPGDAADGGAPELRRLVQTGGCAVGPGPLGGSVPLALLLSLGWRAARRRSGRPARR